MARTLLIFGSRRPSTGLFCLAVVVMSSQLSAGCFSGAGESLADDAVAEVVIFGQDYQDSACDDGVPVTFTVRNVGAVVARDVQVTVRGGSQDYSNNVGDMATAAENFVNAYVTAEDTCGFADNYELTISADPSNGPRYDVRLQIEI